MAKPLPFRWAFDGTVGEGRAIVSGADLLTDVLLYRASRRSGFSQFTSPVVGVAA